MIENHRMCSDVYSLPCNVMFEIEECESYQKYNERVRKSKNFKIYQSGIRGLYECICFNNHKHCHSCVHDSDYRTPKSLQITCSFHRAVLKKYLDKLYTFASRFIDSEYGRIHNNWCECGFQQIWASGIKRNRISADHWKMSGFIGLLNSNQTPMYDIMGVDYCWQLWVLAHLPELLWGPS